jgi:hypothetical protein
MTSHDASSIYILTPYQIKPLIKAVQRIIGRNRQLRDPLVCRRTFSGLSSIDVKIVTNRIGANTRQLMLAAHIPVCHTGGNNQHIAGIDMQGFTIWPTKSYIRTALYTTQDFMGARMIMIVSKNATLPGINPMIFRKLLLYTIGFKKWDQVEDVRVIDNRQDTVGKDSRIFKVNQRRPVRFGVHTRMP